MSRIFIYSDHSLHMGRYPSTFSPASTSPNNNYLNFKVRASLRKKNDPSMVNPRDLDLASLVILEKDKKKDKKNTRPKNRT